MAEEKTAPTKISDLPFTTVVDTLLPESSTIVGASIAEYEVVSKALTDQGVDTKLFCEVILERIHKTLLDMEIAQPYPLLRLSIRVRSAGYSSRKASSMGLLTKITPRIWFNAEKHSPKEPHEVLRKCISD